MRRVRPLPQQNESAAVDRSALHHSDTSPSRGLRRYILASCLLIAWVTLLAFAALRTPTPRPPQLVTSGRSAALGRRAPGDGAFRCNATQSSTFVQEVVDRSSLRVRIPFTPQMRRDCHHLAPNDAHGASAASATDASAVMSAFLDRAWSVTQPSQEQQNDHHLCARAINVALARNTTMAAAPHLRISFDYVITYANGSAPGFRKRWCDAAARGSQTSNYVTELHSNDTALEYQRLQRIRDQIAAARCVEEEFPAERFRDWGELLVALRSIARCKDDGVPLVNNAEDIARADNTQKLQPRSPKLPLSGRVILIVSHPDQVPTFLEANDRCGTTTRTQHNDSKLAEHPRCFTFAAFMPTMLDVLIVYHDELAMPSGLADGDGVEYFNSNAIETFLHRVPELLRRPPFSIDPSATPALPWFLYGNNDMLYGRCPMWHDYLKVDTLSRRASTSSRAPEDNPKFLDIHFTPLVYAEGILPPSRSKLPEVIRRQDQILSSFIRQSDLLSSSISPTNQGEGTVARLGFAHYPRLVSTSLLRWLLEEHTLSRTMHDAVAATRANRLQRSISGDVWVPYVMDHVLLLGRGLKITTATDRSSFCEYCLVATNKNGAGTAAAVQLCPGLVNVRPRDVGPGVVSPVKNGNGQPVARLPRSSASTGHQDYLFLMIDSPYRVHKITMELFPNASPRQPQQQQRPKTLPLFITLNDDMPRRLSGRGNDGMLKQAQDDVARLLASMEATWDVAPPPPPDAVGN